MNYFEFSSGRLGTFQKEDAERLAPYVKGFSLMTYDYSNAARLLRFIYCIYNHY